MYTIKLGKDVLRLDFINKQTYVLENTYDQLRSISDLYILVEAIKY